MNMFTLRTGNSLIGKKIVAVKIDQWHGEYFMRWIKLDDGSKLVLEGNVDVKHLCRPRGKPDLRVCYVCGQSKPLSAFYRNSKRPCRACCRSNINSGLQHTVEEIERCKQGTKI